MALKDAILQSLSCILSANSDIRKLAEERIKALEVTDDYPIILLEIILTTEEALEERQMACVLLKKYIKTHWSPEQDNFEHPAITDDIKVKIRSVLPMGLSDVQLKIRTPTAVIMSCIAEQDYPEKWPDMVDIIKEKLLSHRPEDLNGALMFLDECFRIFSYDNIQLIANKFYDIFYGIVQNEMYATSVRAKVVKLVSHLIIANNMEEAAIQEITTINHFCELIGTLLQQPYNTSNDFQLKGAILKAFNQLLLRYSEIVHPSLILLLPTIWEILHKCGQEYVKVIMNINIVPHDANEGEHSIFFEHLVDNIFSLIHTMLETEGIDVHLYNVLPDLMYSIILFMSITPAFERDWEADEKCFFNDDCEDLVCNSIRTTIRSLLVAIVHDLEEANVKAGLNYSIEKHLKEADITKEQSYVYWWRILESVMFTLGNISWVLKKRYPDWCNSICALLTKWTTLLHTNNPLILQARILWVGGRYSVQLNPTCFVKHIESILSNMSGAHHIARISAVRSLSFHCSNTRAKGFHMLIFKNASEPLLEALMTVVDTSDIIYGTALDCIYSILMVNPLAACKNSGRLIQFVINSFLNNIGDPIVIEKCLSLIEELSKNLLLTDNMQQAIFPVFLNIVTNPTSFRLEAIEVQCVAFNVLSYLVKYSPIPLSALLVQEGFPTVYRTVMASSNTNIIESGVDCIRSYLVKSAEQVVRLRDVEGRTGYDCIAMLVMHILDPQKPELTSIVVAKFCIYGLRAIERTSEYRLDMITRALVSKIHTASVMNQDDSIVMVFAYLFHTQLNQVSTILSIMPGPEGDSALKFVFTKWLKKNHCYLDSYEKNLSIISLSKIIEYALTCNCERLLQVTVPAEIRPTTLPEGAHVSSGGDHIPLFVKIFKVLLQVAFYEVHTVCANKEPCSEAPHGFDSIVDTVPDMIDELENISKVNLAHYLTDYLRKFSNTHHLQRVYPFLSMVEKSDLSSFGFTIPHH